MAAWAVIESSSVAVPNIVDAVSFLKETEALGVRIIAFLIIVLHFYGCYWILLIAIFILRLLLAIVNIDTGFLFISCCLCNAVASLFRIINVTAMAKQLIILDYSVAVFLMFERLAIAR
jgi:hypothetical protein